MEEQREQKRKKERKWRAADHIYDSQQLVDSLCASLLPFPFRRKKKRSVLRTWHVISHLLPFGPCSRIRNVDFFFLFLI